MSPHARPAGVDIMAFFDCTAEDRDKILNMSDEEAQKAHFLSDELKEMVVFARAQTRFLEACKSGDVVTVRSMIAEGVVDVLHPREDTGACPLSEAAHGGSVPSSRNRLAVCRRRQYCSCRRNEECLRVQTRIMTC